MTQAEGRAAAGLCVSDGDVGIDDTDIARLRHVRPRHYGRILAVLLIVLFAGFLIKSFAEGQIDWPEVGNYLTWPTILMGVVNTVWLSIASMAIGIALGVACAIARNSPNPVVRSAAIFYAWFFRGTPVILQLLIWFNLALVFPRLGIAGVWDVRTVTVITPAVAALLGFGLNEGAYVSEIVRAGLLSVDRGQYEAARSIGMREMKALRRIILPQAMRVVVPPLGNEFIGLIKMTSLASIVGFNDVLRSAQDVYYTNTKVIELLIVAAIWYLIVVSVLSFGQGFIERRFGRGFSGSGRR
ncbi:amino acid ABC transporter membrane protein, PAAT family [Arboricoccus pini]|uniref:Glutamate/aspartate import permease protein GltK n=1 Tax=Arboricoccus pini TaxID=1963835 RepID=A0A212RUY0_9PROT|nr:amino acid ABC transporter permease [Arboricoccus pini]SNB76516.1 amino acid ABC transporter membrane protein, PAAT family [Arboricoccus pini]